MEDTSSNIELLMELGLTCNEAKVFVALSELGVSTIKNISKASGVMREFIYKIMPALHEKGLVEEIITVPKTFRPIPLNDAYQNLLQNRMKENKDLITKVTEICKKNKNADYQDIDEHYTFMAPPGVGSYNRMKQEDENLRKCKDVIISADHFFKIVDWTAENAEQMAEKSIKVRMITEKNVQKAIKNYPEVFTPQVLSKLRFYEVGYVESTSVPSVIFDKQYVMIADSPDEEIGKTGWLYSNHKGIVEMACCYFETLWDRAIKERKDGWVLDKNRQER